MKSPNKAPLLAAISVLALLSASPAAAQDSAAAEDPADPQQDEDSEILVIADRIRGQVDSAQPPLLVLNEEDIAAYGAGSIAELVEQLAPADRFGPRSR